MAIEYEIIEDKRLVLAKGSGVVTGEDVIRHLDILAADERYIAPMKKLVDYRYIESIKITKDEADRIAKKKEMMSRKYPGEKCAFISPADLTYGTARVHQALEIELDIIPE